MVVTVSSATSVHIFLHGSGTTREPKKAPDHRCYANIYTFPTSATSVTMSMVVVSVSSWHMCVCYEIMELFYHYKYICQYSRCFFLAFLNLFFIIRVTVGYSSGWRGGFAKPVGCRKVPPGFESPAHRHVVSYIFIFVWAYSSVVRAAGS